MQKTRETREQRRERRPTGTERGRRRGRYAERPRNIPAKGWKEIVKRVVNEVGEDHIGIIAAGVGFFSFLAIFPAIAAVISIYGLVVDPQTVQQQLSQITGTLPPGASQAIGGQLSQIAAGAGGALGWGLALSTLLALWSANKGMKALFQGVNIVYDEKSTRGFIKENALTLLFTLGAVILTIISMVMVVAVPAAVGRLGLPGLAQTAIRWLRWPVLAVLAVFALGLVYRFAPVRENPRWRWVSWGAGIATVLWLVASWAFSFYVSNFSNYNQTYGSLAAVVILLLWLMLTSFIVLLGAEINAQMEGQTERDTTTGPEKPMGERGAYHADKVGE
ncbi:MAG: YihY family inner membrane protein [Chitinivibrionales bacterium]|nr:YihY family inner membrane protein [Chitinivibrionales bacterium]MBD3357874.1 YihY family inner membrane protein [Chitinivibrionales bacterium]